MTTPQHKPSRTLRKLVFKSFDGPLANEEELELQAELLASEGARRWYTDAVSLHADLTEVNKASEVCERVFEQCDRSEPASAGDARESAYNASRRVSPSWQGSGAWASTRLALFASILFVGIGIGCSVGLFTAAALQPYAAFVGNGPEWSVDRSVVAKTVGTSDAVLQTADVPETPPTQGLRTGQQVRLESGLIELSHRSGATIILEGPATYEARSDRGGKLFRGKAKVVLPEGLSTFVLSTHAGQLRCGAGEFGIEADSDADGGAIHMQAYPKGLSSEVAGRYVGLASEDYDLKYGQSIVVGGGSGARSIRPSEPREFVSRMPDRRSRPFLGDEIPLGNLFDDSKDASIDEAILTDTFQSAAETVDLGVVAVHDGYLDTDLSIAESGVRVNLGNVGGGGPRVKGLPANDAYRSTSPVPIRTTGIDFVESELGERCEEGVGMCANEMLTFNLDEIREAGQLEDRIMTFVADRVGINDREPPATPFPLMASARFIVLVSTQDEVLKGYIDGEVYPVRMNSDEVYTFDLSERKLPEVIRRDGRFVSFEVPIPRAARFLTLATCMHDIEHDDHAVFSGARLVLGERFSEFAGSPAKPRDKDPWAPLMARAGLLTLSPRD